jgi:hypothetical protein
MKLRLLTDADLYGLAMQFKYSRCVLAKYGPEELYWAVKGEVTRQPFREADILYLETDSQMQFEIVRCLAYLFRTQYNVLTQEQSDEALALWKEAEPELEQTPCC